MSYSNRNHGVGRAGTLSGFAFADRNKGPSVAAVATPSGAANTAPAPAPAPAPVASSAATSTSVAATAAAPSSAVVLSSAQKTAMNLGPVSRQTSTAISSGQRSAAVATAKHVAVVAEFQSTRPDSIVTAECADYRYVVNFKPVARTGILPAGTPMVGGVKISWDPAVVGVDFPGSWVAERNRSEDSERAKLDAEMTRNRAGLPATSSALLTTAARAFLIGFAPQGPNSAVLFVGAVSSRDVDMDSMMGFLKRLLLTGKNVQGGGFGLMAFAVVPKLKAGQAGVAAPSNDYVAYRDRVPGYSVEDARAMAIAAALSKREALQVMISGEIFGGLTVAKSQDLFLDGEAAVKAAIESVAKAATLAEVATGVAGLASGAVAEAEAAKSLPQEEGDAACAAILDRLAAARDSVSAAMSAELAKLAAGPAALASAQQSVAKFTATAHGAEEEIRRIVAERIAAWEAKPSFKALSPQEQFAVRCIMQNKAAPLIARRTDTATTRFTAITSINPDEFAASVAAASQAYAAAQQAATAAISDAIAKVEEIRRIIGLPFYLKKLLGLPVWAWGAGGAALLVGGAVYVRSRRKKAAASADARTKA